SGLLRPDRSMKGHPEISDEQRGRSMVQIETMRVRIETMVHEIQDVIREAIEHIDRQRFRQDMWTRPEGGGGISCILQDGNVFEKAGVNVSTVMGKLSSEAMR